MINTETKQNRRTLGLRIVQARESLDITQMELAQRIGVHRAFMSRVERGSAAIPAKYLPALYEALPSLQQAQTPAQRAREDEMRLLATLRDMSACGRLTPGVVSTLLTWLETNVP